MKGYRQTYQVQRFDVDRTQHIRVSKLVDYLIDTSFDHFEQLVVDYQKETGEEVSPDLAWVIIQYQIKIHRLPRVGEEIEIETFAKGFARVFAYRDFIMYDKKGDVLVEMESTWVMMDPVKRQLVKITPERMAPFKSAEANQRPRRTPKPRFSGDAIVHQQNYSVRYFDIDLNNHVNNTIYFNWMFDTLPGEFLDQHQPQEINIKYEREVRYGQQIQSDIEIIEEDGQTVTLHRIQTGDVENARAEVVWKKI